MISRVADHCFWLGRYIERAESTARVLFVTRNLALDAELPAERIWQPVVIVAGEEPAFTARFGAAALGDGEVVQRYMTWDEKNLSSIRCSIAAARDNARSIREVVSLEVWETINELHLWLGSDAARAEFHAERYGFYRHIRQSAQLALGLLRSTMLHDTPLDFIWLGVLLERVGQTGRILDVHHYALTRQDPLHPIVDTALWLSLLRACSGFEPFMKRSQGKVTAAAVGAFLVLEPRFPRSVRYCVHSAHERLAAIRPPADAALPGARALERLAALDERLAHTTADSLDQGRIHELLTHVVDEIAAICEVLATEVFATGAQVAVSSATG